MSISIERLASPFLYPNQHRIIKQHYDAWAEKNAEHFRFYPSHGGIRCPVMFRRGAVLGRAILFLPGNGQFAYEVHNALKDWSLDGPDMYVIEYMGNFDPAFRTSEHAIKQQLDGFMNAFGNVVFDVIAYSFGTHFATWLATRFPARVASLTLLYPFLSIADVAAGWFPTLSCILRSCLVGLLDTASLASRVACPCRVFAGEQDRSCTPEQGRRLAVLIPGATFTLCAGMNHVNVDWEAVRPPVEG
jgi:pimeloyl-ACP methyl ester carboxylesterase